MTRKLRLGILISGRGSNMECLVRACADPSFPAEPAVVISNKAAAPGLEKARGYSIPAFSVSAKDCPDRSEFESRIQNLLLDHNVDIVCLAGFMRILSADFVRNWPYRILNIHPSLLPDYPGLDTYNRALNDGRTESGCTVHYVTADLDAGPIVVQHRVPVLPGDTEHTLSARILEQEHIAYPRALRMVAEKILNSDPA